MTIALVTPYFPDEHTIDSGIANHYLLLAQSLAAKGNKVIVVHVRPRHKNEPDNFSKHTLAEGIIVLTYKSKVPVVINKLFKHKWAIIDFALKIRSMRVTSQVLRKLIQQYGIEVIETTSYFSLCYFLPYKKLKAPVAVRVSTTFSQIMNEHYPFKSRGMDLIAKMEITFIKRSRYILTHAQSHALELERLYNIDAKQFEIIPHGIDLPLIADDTTAGEVIKILYAGRFEYRKGTDVLLAAIPLVLQKTPNVVFQLIGSDTGNDYQNRFKNDNPDAVLQKVAFGGKVDHDALSQAYQSCDIFVAPSRYESFGLIFIEAMSYGKPAIGCNVGGVPEIITDNYNGLFAEAGNAQSLADKIISLVDDYDLRKRLGLNARKTIEDKFTGDRLAANSLTYYTKMIKDFN
ncbi:Glycosyltransferase involved in cell wall bisynthesis [Mucilaginibacter gossypiicola]|uniref:Glycosyltransferase involved in cell wall bisynthesis n=1 Tax=Mucilaginibacter gossypiicola TaxID=551995 RepID=A0A1H8N229_9SPHI|nr:glycosyltransferase family 4 protein [Mucilaginibacter gossypiicola]SEO23576.1 Glycosyltransferase involved in cell wall bisynthesis [Mucilaginibacter gossypiicola]